MIPTDVTTLLHQFTQRYRTALLTKTLVLAALGFALASVLAWRLAALRAAPAWRVGVPAILAAATGAGLGWWLRRRWPSRRASAAHLDRLLGLKQRLITAEEFATVTAPPALYPLLVADASTWVADTRTRYPRPLDRTAAALLLLLLLALAWPLEGHSPLQQLAQLPKPTPPPVKPPEPTPTPPPPQSSSSQSGSQGQSQSSSGQNQQQQTGGGGSSSESGGKQDASGGGKHGASQGSAGANERASAGKSGQSGANAGSQPQPGRDRSGSQQASPSSQQQGGAGSAQAQQGQSSGSQSSSGDAQGGTQGAAQQARTSAGGKSGDNTQAGVGSSQSFEAKAAQAQSGDGSSGSPGNAALQQDIQQLLKEVSGEIRTLQAQLAAAKGQPPPAPGTTTDPELYGAAEPPGQTGTGTVPIQLKTDAAATTGAARAASGVGRPSGEVAAASPTAQAEPAQLSDEPLEEPAGSRETVPPEYRDVFDRLNRRPRGGSHDDPDR